MNFVAMRIVGEGHDDEIMRSCREAQRRKTLGRDNGSRRSQRCCARPINSLCVKALERGDKEYNKKLVGA